MGEGQTFLFQNLPLKGVRENGTENKYRNFPLLFETQRYKIIFSVITLYLEGSCEPNKIGVELILQILFEE